MNAAEVQTIVAAKYGMTRRELLARHRSRTTVRARQLAMLICRDALELSYPEIGKAFGNRDHTTAMSGVAKARSKLERETIWRDDLRAIHGSIIGPKKAQEVRYRVAV